VGRPTIQRMLDLMPRPAFVRNGCFDVLAANDLGRALFSPLYDALGPAPNGARYLFLTPGAAEFSGGFEKVLDDCVASTSGTHSCSRPGR